MRRRLGLGPGVSTALPRCGDMLQVDFVEHRVAQDVEFGGSPDRSDGLYRIAIVADQAELPAPGERHC